MSKVGIGIDFGTSNSAAAVFDGEQLQLVRLEQDDDIIPSATYIDRSLTAQTGQQAVSQYIADNTGRTVERFPKWWAKPVSLEGGGGDEVAEVDTATQKIYGAPITDSGMQGRLFRGNCSYSAMKLSAD